LFGLLEVRETNLWIDKG
jgi:hypothetical protein